MYIYICIQGHSVSFCSGPGCKKPLSDETLAELRAKLSGTDPNSDPFFLTEAEKTGAEEGLAAIDSMKLKPVEFEGANKSAYDWLN